MTKGVFDHDAMELDLSQEMLEVNDESIYREAAIHPVHGLKIGSKLSGLSQRLKATPTASQLTSGGAVGSLTPRVLLTAAFGAEHAALGTTVNDASASVTSFIVTSVANLKKGSFILVTISGEMEWTKITNISTLTVTVSPALSSAPADTAVIRNLYNYCPAEAHTSSMTVYRGWRDLAASDVTCEYILNGVFGDVVFKLPMGKLASMDFSGQVTSWTGPAASGSIDTGTVVTDEMGASIVFKASVYLAASVARATRLVCESVEFAHANAFEMVRDGGATETVSSVVNTGGRPRATTAKVVLRYDNAWDVGFAADTAYRFVVVLQSGTGTTASFWIWEIPAAKLIQKPKLTKVGNRLYAELMLGGFQDSSVTLASETGDDLSRCLATARVAFG